MELEYICIIKRTWTLKIILIFGGMIIILQSMNVLNELILFDFFETWQNKFLQYLNVK